MVPYKRIDLIVKALFGTLRAPPVSDRRWP
jgi:hypothetical protein